LYLFATLDTLKNIMKSITVSAVFLHLLPWFIKAQQSRCGNCWCIPNDATSSNTGTCPSYPNGIYQSFDASISSAFKTFTTTSAPLLNPTGCYPFFDSIGAQSYPESQTAQCVIPQQTPGAVCAYQYTSPPSHASATNTSCYNRVYELQTYATASAATANGSVVVHNGTCGVCSTAQDVAVRMETFHTLQALSVSCGTSYVFTQDFTGLVACYQAVGFTSPCATLWAHFAATNTVLCASVCAGQLTLNGPAPLCTLGTCLSCGANFQGAFTQLAGIGYVLKWNERKQGTIAFVRLLCVLIFITLSTGTRQSATNAGFDGDVAEPCSSFYPVDWDPCFTSNSTPLAPTSSAKQPTLSPNLSPAPTKKKQITAPVVKKSGESVVSFISLVILQGAAILSGLMTL
jgi:hypothetical protein